jgi:two-component system NarL family response regulator
MKVARAPRRERIRIIIADDHPIVREGLRALLKTQRDMELVAEADTGPLAVEQFSLFQPDLLLLDLRMPEMDGFAVLRAIMAKDSRAKIIVLTSYSGDQDIYAALQAGAKAYLLKDTPHQELLECIRTVNEGRRWVPAAVGARLAAQMGMPKLTKRETEIVRLIVTGKSNKEIAVALDISQSTVKVHLLHIFKKLGATGRLDALRIVLQRGVAHMGTYI